MITYKFKCKEGKHSSEQASYVYIKSAIGVKASEIATMKADSKFLGTCGDNHRHWYYYSEKID